ncbi:MutS-related protein [Nocardia arizonensis]|uniref:MutS-related protein n=1 Tax=Nocardia arizonensis TaxID=1141647 RepID=UPI00147255DC|nr:DNA mismatch repair protein [Nocardia arizonensis]
MAADLVTRSLVDPTVITYRQRVVMDSCANPDVVRELYAIVNEAAELRRWTAGRDRGARGKLYLSLEPLTKLIGFLRLLRTKLTPNLSRFKSEGFIGFTEAVAGTFGEEYLSEVERYIDAMEFEHGFEISAELGPNGGIANPVLHEPPSRSPRRKSVFAPRDRHTVEISATDESAKKFIWRLVGTSLDRVADVVSHVTEALAGFFHAARTELAFLVGCVNLHERLRTGGYPVCFPRPLPSGSPASYSFRSLRDPALCLSARSPIEGNSIEGKGRLLTVITGANSGGKSTFLRSLGTAQLMMQAGMFVVSEAFEADIRTGVFTHFRIQDDSSMTYGRLKEELVRMRDLTGRIESGSMVLWNEPFASTSEREATEILTPITEALVDAGVKVIVVTHLYDFASMRAERRRTTDLFLCAQRRSDGSRTFRLEAGLPGMTSHAMDIYQRVFGRDRA